MDKTLTYPYYELALFLGRGLGRDDARHVVYSYLYGATLPVEIECRLLWFLASTGV